MENKIRPATDADLADIARRQAVVQNLLRAHCGGAGLEGDVDDLFLLQQLVDEGVVGPDQPDELRCLGIVLGQVLAARTPLRWVTVERGDERVLAMQVPGTKVLAYPEEMIAKRVEDGREIDVSCLYAAVAQQFERTAGGPGEARAAHWESPVGNPDRLDLVGNRDDGGIDLILVCSAPLDDSPRTRAALARKLRNYCQFARSDEFAEEFGAASEKRVRIVLSVTADLPKSVLALVRQVWGENQPPARLVIDRRTRDE